MRTQRLPTVETDAPAKKAVMFGRYRGTLVQDLPTGYLEWLVNDFDAHPHDRPLVAAAVMELERRKQQPGAAAT